MTRDEIPNMPAGRELDALVAEKVMGGKLLFPPPHNAVYKNGTWVRGLLNWHPSTDIAAAWEVNEKAGPYVLIPVGIYTNYDEWNEPGRSKKPDYFAWIALPYQATMPRESEDKYIDWIEEQLTTDMLAKTPALAICHRALLDQMEEE